MGGTGVYPGSFNPLTVAHLAIAGAARAACGLDRVDLVVSRVALAKGVVDRPRFEDRMAVLHRAAAARPWLGVAATDAQLIAEIAAGYDVVVLGTDKWAQVLDPAFYGGSAAARDAAVARLPRVAVARRPPHPVPDGHAGGVVVLDVDGAVEAVSATAARAGRREWMAPEARAFDDETGAWSDPARYDAWLSSQSP